MADSWDHVSELVNGISSIDDETQSAIVAICGLIVTLYCLSRVEVAIRSAFRYLFSFNFSTILLVLLAISLLAYVTIKFKLAGKLVRFVNSDQGWRLLTSVSVVKLATAALALAVIAAVLVSSSKTPYRQSAEGPRDPLLTMH